MDGDDGMDIHWMMYMQDEQQSSMNDDKVDASIDSKPKKKNKVIGKRRMIKKRYRLIMKLGQEA